MSLRLHVCVCFIESSPDQQDIRVSYTGACDLLQRQLHTSRGDMYPACVYLCVCVCFILQLKMSRDATVMNTSVRTKRSDSKQRCILYVTESGDEREKHVLLFFLFLKKTKGKNGSSY